MTLKNPNRQSRFIQAAIELFYTKGYDSTSVQDIIDAVGMSKGGFYHYFPSKQAVLEGVVDALAAESVQPVATLVERSELSAVDKLNAAFLSLEAWKDDDIDKIKATASAVYRAENIRMHYLLDVKKKTLFVPMFAKIIEQGRSESLFDVENSLHSADFVYSILMSTQRTFITKLLNTELPQDAAVLVNAKYASAQLAIERILDAPQGSLNVTHRQLTKSWFE